MALTDIEEVRGEIEYRLVEARAVVKFKSAEAEQEATSEHRHFVNYPRYEMGYVAALEAILAKLTDDEDVPEFGDDADDENLEERLREADRLDHPGTK